jgi:hypothetical protein
MGMAVIQQQIQGGKTSLRLLLIVLAVVLFALPVAAVAKLVLATDDELDDVVAQSLLEFTTVRRTVQDRDNTSRYFTHDVAILKVNAMLKIENMAMGRTLMGYYNGNWDIEMAGASAIWGGVGGRVAGNTIHPIYFKGLRLEVAYTTAGHFSFLRIGSDDFSGILDLAQGNSGAGSGSIQRVSMDGRIYAQAQINLDIDVNDRRKNNHVYVVTIPTTNIYRLYYNTATGNGDYDRGTTDFYITMSDYIYQDGTTTVRNAVAINPRANVHGVANQRHHLPGYGWWMHFNQIAADAAAW